MGSTALGVSVPVFTGFGVKGIGVAKQCTELLYSSQEVLKADGPPPRLWFLHPMNQGIQSQAQGKKGPTPYEHCQLLWFLLDTIVLGRLYLHLPLFLDAYPPTHPTHIHIHTHVGRDCLFIFRLPRREKSHRRCINCNAIQPMTQAYF